LSPFEYLLALVSILIGLAIADLSVSLHHLLRARQRIRWDWLSPAAALLVLLLILNFWWGFYRMGQNEVWTRYWAFLVLAASLISMFLLASAALPDSIPEAGLDLRAYYFENQRYFWVLFAVFTASITAVSFVALANSMSSWRWAIAVIPNIILTVLLLSLAFIRKRWYHSVLVLLLLALFGLQWSALRLA
jgi:hypothetical protein